MIKGLHHAGISVRDLDRSIAFYCTLIGMSLLSRSQFDDGRLDRITRLRGARGYSAMLRVGTQIVELFQFIEPVPKSPEQPRAVCDHGISHFCIEVENLPHEYERLKAAGVEFHCEPQPFGGMRATYARDPDGNVFELLELPAAAASMP